MDIGKGFFLLCFPSLWSPWQVQVFIEIDCPGETSPERDCWLWQSNSMVVCNSWLQAIFYFNWNLFSLLFSPLFFYWQASCIWLLSLVKYSGAHEVVQVQFYLFYQYCGTLRLLFLHFIQELSCVSTIPLSFWRLALIQHGNQFFGWV